MPTSARKVRFLNLSAIWEWPGIGCFCCIKRSRPLTTGRCGHRPLRSKSQLSDIGFAIILFFTALFFIISIPAASPPACGCPGVCSGGRSCRPCGSGGCPRRRHWRSGPQWEGCPYPGGGGRGWPRRPRSRSSPASGYPSAPGQIPRDGCGLYSEHPGRFPPFRSPPR